jgi:hypothetical protein
LTSVFSSSLFFSSCSEGNPIFKIKCIFKKSKIVDVASPQLGHRTSRLILREVTHRQEIKDLDFLRLNFVYRIATWNCLPVTFSDIGSFSTSKELVFA